MVNKKLFSIFFAGILTAIMAIFSIQSYAAYESYYVYNERDLKIATNTAKNTDYIIFENDVYLTNDIKINTSVTVDLNGHIVYLLNDDAAIIIGDKVFDHIEKNIVKKPGYYSYENKLRVIEHPDKLYLDDDGNLYSVPQDDTTEYVTERVWHPETEEVTYKDTYKYCDDVDIQVQNGIIVRCDGKDGNDGEEDTWFNYKGRDGKTASAPIKMISGIIRFENVSVYGGNGGNGGDGSYQKLIHIPFGGGSGGNGGNGADGGAVIQIAREECRVYLGYNASLIPGEGGKGGKLSKANANYWIYRGWNGDNGKDGKDGQQILYIAEE